MSFLVQPPGALPVLRSGRRTLEKGWLEDGWICETPGPRFRPTHADLEVEEEGESNVSWSARIVVSGAVKLFMFKRLAGFWGWPGGVGPS